MAADTRADTRRWALTPINRYGASQRQYELRRTATATEWAEQLHRLVEFETCPRSDKGPVTDILTVVATETNPRSASLGATYILKGCPVCGELRPPRRRHVCDRHFNPRVGDVYQRTNTTHRWAGEGDPPSYFDRGPDTHPHLWRTETHTDRVEVTDIRLTEAWSWEGTSYPAERQIVVREALWDYVDETTRRRILTESDAVEYSPSEWRNTVRASFAGNSCGPAWELVVEGTGSALSDLGQ